MTDKFRIRDIKPTSYPSEFMAALNNPANIWDKAFKSHITKAAQHLIITLFFCADYGAELEELRDAFESVHAELCREYGVARDAMDFEDSLQDLEGSFVEIRGTTVTFINPSIRDYLDAALTDKRSLMTAARAAQTMKWAESIENHFDALEPTARQSAELVKCFLPLTSRLHSKAALHARAAGGLWDRYDIGHARRLGLLVKWWSKSGAEGFIRAASNVARQPQGSLSAWHDGPALVELLSQLAEIPSEQLSKAQGLEDAIETTLITMLDAGPDLDDLDGIVDTIFEHDTNMSDRLKGAADDAIRTSLENLPDHIGSVDSESTLDDYYGYLERLSSRLTINDQIIRRAESAIADRIAVVRDASTDDGSWTPESASSSPDRFTDENLRMLFSGLLAR